MDPGASSPALIEAMQKTASIAVQLEELRCLFDTILPGEGISVAIYEGLGRLRHQAGPYGFDVVLPKEVCGPQEARGPKELPGAVSAPLVLAGADRMPVAYAKVDAAKELGMSFFAVAAAEPLANETLTRLCRMGADFLARTLGPIGQAKTLQQLVREQEAIINNMSDGLLVIDRGGVLRYLNTPGARMLGVDAKTSIGRTLKDILDFEPVITPILETKVGYVDRELQIRSSKVNLHIIDTAVPIIDEDGTVVSIVNTFHEISRAKQLSNRMAGDRARYRFSDIIGRSHVMATATAVAKRAAKSDANVLLYGESGTGKEVFAQAIHNEGHRSKASFVAVNCAALPRELIESELFGYSPGSFTGADRAGRIGRFELAAGGTIFLDEISEMPLDVQAKLLRVLQERQVTRIGGASSIAIDVRVIAAANRDLVELVAEKAFREDLFYRLNVLRIDLPPLRSRREDIDLLVDHSIRRICMLLHRPVLELGDEAMNELRGYNWPGNVRQLQNVIERLVNMTDGDYAARMPAGWLGGDIAQSLSMPGDDRISIQTLAEAEERAIMGALAAFKNNVTQAAAALGITRPTLYSKMRLYGLQR